MILRTYRQERIPALLYALGSRYGGSNSSAYTGCVDGEEISGYSFKAPDRGKYYAITRREKNGNVRWSVSIHRHPLRHCFERPNGTWQPVIALPNGRMHVTAVVFDGAGDALSVHDDFIQPEFSMSPAEYRKHYPIPKY